MLLPRARRKKPLTHRSTCDEKFRSATTARRDAEPAGLPALARHTTARRRLPPPPPEADSSRRGGVRAAQAHTRHAGFFFFFFFFFFLGNDEAVWTLGSPGETGVVSLESPPWWHKHINAANLLSAGGGGGCERFRCSRAPTSDNLRARGEDVDPPRPPGPGRVSELGPRSRGTPHEEGRRMVISRGIHAAYLRATSAPPAGPPPPPPPPPPAPAESERR